MPWVPLGLLHGLLAISAGAPGGDEPDFLRLADRLTRGHYALPGSHNAIDYLWHGPGLPAFLAPLRAVEAPLWVVRLEAALPATIAAALLAGSLRRCGVSSRAALAAGYALGLYPPLLATTAGAHKEPLSVLLVTLFLAILLRAKASVSVGRMAASGACLGALVMVRVEYGWVLVAIMLLAALATAVRRAGDSARLALVAGGVGLLVTAPWLTYTADISGQFPYWGNSGGLSLFWMASPGAPAAGAWHAMHTVARDDELTRFRPEVFRLSALPPLARDGALQSLATRSAQEHPGTLAEHLLANVGRLVAAAPLGPPQPIWPVLLALPANLALLGWLVTRRRRRPLLRPELALLIPGLAMLGALVHLLPAAEPRMLVPLLPLALTWGTCRASDPGCGVQPQGATCPRPSE